MKHHEMEGFAATVFLFLLFGGLTAAYIFDRVSVLAAAIIMILAFSLVSMCIGGNKEEHFPKRER